MIRGLAARLPRPDGAAAGLGLAVAGGQVLSLAFTIALTHILGSADYSVLAALIAAWLVLVIPGTALQAAAARDLAAAGPDAARANAGAYVRGALAVTAALAIAGALARAPLASLIGVDDAPWGAAAVLPAAGFWLLLSLQRGVLQGIGDYRLVGASVVVEASARIALAVAIAVANASVSLVWVATVGALPLTSLILAPLLRRRVDAAAHAPGTSRAQRLGLGALAREAWIPIVALSLVAFLQNIDVIAARHVAPGHASGAYAAASLAGKAIVWLAVGLGMYLLPETARQLAAGNATRPLLARCMALLLPAALSITIVFLVAARPILEIAFGHSYGTAAGVLPVLAAAMTGLAVTYLCVQYELGLHRRAFALLLLAAAAIAPPLLLAASNLTRVADRLLALQLALALAMTLVSVRRRTGQPIT